MDKAISNIYDIGIIGGGIAGTAIARDAALRGLRVILWEKNTFGSGTSSRSSKLIHGGIRYLDTAWTALKKGRLKEFWKNFRFVFCALRETHLLEKMAPKLVRPISLIIPLYKKKGRSLAAAALGSFLYGIMSLVSGGRKFPRILWNQEAVLKLIPGLNPENLSGAVIIWDHTTDDLELVRQTACDAIKHGVTAFEQARAVNYHYDEPSKLYLVSVERNGRIFQYPVRKLINASGPWIDKTRKLFDHYTEDFIVPVAGSHITLKPFLKHSMILEAEDGRIFFIINRHGTARIGTTEWIHHDPDTLRTPKEDVSYLLNSIRHYFPGLKVSESSILSKDSGIRPLARPKNAQSPHDISREHEFRTDSEGIVHILGIKLTDHRRAAEEIIDRLIPELSSSTAKTTKHSQTARTPL
ncbi:MAG: FAD-dependent oxidoreductase [Candidatus Omnitrophica bacterium]|nr:FAD-dependent oxidoreductase [Candidatus Omnitrophota bacterium]